MRWATFSIYNTHKIHVCGHKSSNNGPTAKKMKTPLLLVP